MLFLQSASFTSLRYFTDIFHLKFIKSSILNLNLQYSYIMSDITDHTVITDHNNNNSNNNKNNNRIPIEFKSHCQINTAASVL